MALSELTLEELEYQYEEGFIEEGEYDNLDVIRATKNQDALNELMKRIERKGYSIYEGNGDIDWGEIDNLFTYQASDILKGQGAA